MSDKERSRIVYIDCLRAVGTLLVILAHVGIPDTLANIRCFDVILLVFISGSCIKYKNGYFSYIIKRFKRLVIPTWILLAVLFSASGVICFVLNREQLYSIDKIIRSFLFLQGSIGYIWIVRIYIYIALLTPLIILANKRIKSSVLYICFAFLLFAAYEVIYLFLDGEGVLYYVFEMLWYCTIAALGFRFNNYKSNEKQKFLVPVIVISLILFLCYLMFLGFGPNNSKYPPHLYYVSYGLLSSSILTIVFVYLQNKIKLKAYKPIVFLSKNSFTLYLVHILILSIVKFISDKFPVLNNWLLKYLFVLLLAIVITIFISMMKNKTKGLAT